MVEIKPYVTYSLDEFIGLQMKMLNTATRKLQELRECIIVVVESACKVRCCVLNIHVLTLIYKLQPC